MSVDQTDRHLRAIKLLTSTNTIFTAMLDGMVEFTDPELMLDVEHTKEEIQELLEEYTELN